MNFDGWESFYVGCMGIKGRFNVNGVDLNRNFLDFYEG